MGCGTSAPADPVEAPTPKPKEPAPVKAEVKVDPASGLPTLLPQPANPAGKIVLIECEGGSNKKADGQSQHSSQVRVSRKQLQNIDSQ